MIPKATNVYDTFSPLEILLKSLGLLPLFRVPNKLWKQATNWAYLGLTCTLYCLSYIISFKGFFVFYNQWVLMVTTNIKIGSAFCQPILSIALGIVVSSRYWKILEELDHLDKKLKHVVSKSVNHNQQRQKMLFFLMGYALTFLVLLLVNGIYSEFKASLYMISVYNGLHLITVSVQFCSLTWTIHSRFRLLNVILRMYFPINSRSTELLTTAGYMETVVCNEKDQLFVLRQIKVLHDKLNDLVELVNYCFSVQITFCVGLCFIVGVVCSFGLFKTFLYRDELVYIGIMNFVWYLYYLFFVLGFIAVGSKVTREGKYIGVLVHKAINCSTSGVVINELNIFSQQLLHRSPVISCGLFVYDWTLLYTMIGATATYLIILIQFDVSFPNSTNLNKTATL